MSQAFLKPDGREASGRLLFAGALLAGGLLRLVLLGAPDLFGPDEGAWAVAARNAAEGGLRQILAPGRTPLGDPFGTPAFFPALLSVMVRIFGAEEWAIRLPSVFAGLVGAFVLERVVRRGYGQPAGHLAGAFAALFPPLVSASRAAAAEPALVALGLGGMIFSLRAFEEDLPAEGLLGGALFGLGFLTDGDAVLLFLGPILVALLARPALFSLGRTKLSLVLLGAGAVATVGLYLLAVAVACPGALPVVLDGLVGSAPDWPFASGDASAFDASLRSIVRSLFLFLPLAGLGALYLSRARTEEESASGATSGERRLSHEILWQVAGAEMLVLVAVAGRFRLSSIPVLTALAAFCGFGATALLNPRESEEGRRREALGTAAWGLVVLAAAAWLVSRPEDPLFGGRQAPISSGAALASVAGIAVVAAILVSGRARMGGRTVVLLLSGLLVAAGIESAALIRRDLLAHRTFARETGEQLAPVLLPLAPRDLAFRAPDPDAFAFRLFRTGRSFTDAPTAESLEAGRRRGPTVAWVFRPSAPEGPAAPSAAARGWLAANAIEVTRDVAARVGRDPRVRVFVARPAAATSPP